MHGRSADSQRSSFVPDAMFKSPRQLVPEAISSCVTGTD
jgi:hypothetical protein